MSHMHGSLTYSEFVSLAAYPIAFERRHLPAGEASMRPKCGNYLARTLCAHQRGSGEVNQENDATKRKAPFRVRRYHQMVAAIGWLQWNSGRSSEGRVSQARLKENSSRSSESRVPGQKWMAAAYSGAVAFRSITGPLMLSR